MLVPVPVSMWAETPMMDLLMRCGHPVRSTFIPEGQNKGALLLLLIQPRVLRASRGVAQQQRGHLKTQTADTQVRE